MLRGISLHGFKIIYFNHWYLTKILSSRDNLGEQAPCIAAQSCQLEENENIPLTLPANWEDN